jgi:thymidylate synthase (FAD)
MDNSRVKLVGVTQPYNVDSCDTAEDLIGYVARVSNPDNQNNKKTVSKLLKYLIKHKHWSPFEMVHVVMEIETTRDIARQILRHRSFSFQEFSQRYAEAPGFIESRQARLQDYTNRQNSLESGDVQLEAQWKKYQQEVINTCMAAYDWALNEGIAKEQARAVLPIHYCDLRMAHGTQKEHMYVAQRCWTILCLRFPFLSEWTNDN